MNSGVGLADAGFELDGVDAFGTYSMTTTRHLKIADNSHCQTLTPTSTSEPEPDLQSPVSSLQSPTFNL